MDTVFTIPDPSLQAMYAGAFFIALFFYSMDRKENAQISLMYLLTVFMLSDWIFFGAVSVYFLVGFLVSAILANLH